uniref:Adenylate kinase n=1 Tax=Hirondellea gigas TaxID=1518452 RepID=A0A6A7G8R6_9CRUS
MYTVRHQTKRFLALWTRNCRPLRFAPNIYNPIITRSFSSPTTSRATDASADEDSVPVHPFISKIKPPKGENDIADESEIMPTSGDVEDPHLVFEIAWNNLVNMHGDENMTFPKDIMWLSGAPGAGKGVMTDFIMKTRGITAKPIETSSLLKSPEAEAIKARGDLVADRHVVQLVLQKLLEPQYASGVIVDGFPRTPVQAECIKLLYDKMRDYVRKYEGSETKHFRRPIFHIMVLFVEEDVSVVRQLSRGDFVRKHNKRVQDTGIGRTMTVRSTDSDAELARGRYRQFKELVYESLQNIKEKFAFHFIDADALPEMVQQRILKELEYQSSLELHQITFEKVRRLSLASEVIENSRYELVRRLDRYSREKSDLFDRVINHLLNDFFGIIRLQALSGKAIIRSENPVFEEPEALNMALDLFTERGYTAVLDFHKRRHPQRIDEHGLVILREQRIFEFHIEFPRPTIRHTKKSMTN